MILAVLQLSTNYNDSVLFESTESLLSHTPLHSSFCEKFEQLQIPSASERWFLAPLSGSLAACIFLSSCKPNNRAHQKVSTLEEKKSIYYTIWQRKSLENIVHRLLNHCNLWGVERRQGSWEREERVRIKATIMGERRESKNYGIQERDMADWVYGWWLRWGNRGVGGIIHIKLV